ncbi:MAG: RIO1 family regulatory kinase/ATPase [Acidimicrobiales bacterium]
MPDDAVTIPEAPAFTPFVPDWDVSDPDICQSTYFGAEHGPRPTPEWVITDDAAHQIERGILKTGKEADVHLVERRLGPRHNLLAAKRYRSAAHRQFRDDSRYRRARPTGNRRTDLAIAQGSRAGVAFRADQWVGNEFAVLGRLWAAGVSVPYPVQRDGSELMIEYLGDDDGAAPRLVHAPLVVGQAADLFAQAVANVRLCAAQGIVHGDLSPYNMLVWDGRLYLIDFPQAVDPIVHPDGLRLLERDIANLCQWGRRHGVACDPGELCAEVMAVIF